MPNLISIIAIAGTILIALITIGLKTMHPDKLKELVEGKFVDALRAVAAEMGMEDLHEQRVDFVQKVQQAVSEDLLKNGLELESVSLTGLDQTGKEFFNPDNAFDAAGLTKLTEEIEDRRKRRNEIELETEVAIATKNLEAEKQKLTIHKENEYARLEQEREIEIRRAAQASEIAREQAEKEKEAQQAAIQSKQQVDTSGIMAERAVEEERIDKDRLLKEKEILKAKAIELAEQERAIAIAEKSKAQSEAQAEADRSKAIAVKEEEGVITARETEKAERLKSIELVQARQAAEREAISIIVAAEADKNAALDKAEAVRTIANADAEKLRIRAQSEADAEKLQADALEKRYAVDAKGEYALNEARNLLSAEQIAMQVRTKLIEMLPEIIRESVKPMEQIDGIKIYQVDGLMGGGNGKAGDGAVSTNGGSLADQLVNSALRYRGQAPLLDSLLSDIGIKPGDLNGFTAPLKETSETPVSKIPPVPVEMVAEKSVSEAAEQRPSQ
jgi:uncharacterized membrane protein YqiK